MLLVLARGFLGSCTMRRRWISHRRLGRPVALVSCPIDGCSNLSVRGSTRAGTYGNVDAVQIGESVPEPGIDELVPASIVGLLQDQLQGDLDPVGVYEEF